MATLDNEMLFDPGTSRLRVGPIKLRHTIQDMPGSLGARIDAQGTQARQITQTGVLIADGPAALQARVDAVRRKLDGRAHTLADNLGRSWPDTVMTRFDAQEFVRVGARWKVGYRIEYLQAIV